MFYGRSPWWTAEARSCWRILGAWIEDASKFSHWSLREQAGGQVLTPSLPSYPVVGPGIPGARETLKQRSQMPAVEHLVYSMGMVSAKGTRARY